MALFVSFLDTCINLQSYELLAVHFTAYAVTSRFRSDYSKFGDINFRRGTRRHSLSDGKTKLN